MEAEASLASTSSAFADLDFFFFLLLSRSLRRFLSFRSGVERRLRLPLDFLEDAGTFGAAAASLRLFVVVVVVVAGLAALIFRLGAPDFFFLSGWLCPAARAFLAICLCLLRAARGRNMTANFLTRGALVTLGRTPVVELIVAPPRRRSVQCICKSKR